MDLKTIPDDAKLDAMSDGDLLQMLEETGTDTASVGDRDAVLAALKGLRDAALAAETAGEKPTLQPEPVADPPETDTPDLDGQVIDTTAEDEPLPVRKTFGQVLAAETAGAFKAGDMTLHAAIHNFEMAAGDFKRAAQQVVGKLPADSELRQALNSIISDL